MDERNNRDVRDISREECGRFGSLPQPMKEKANIHMITQGCERDIMSGISFIEGEREEEIRIDVTSGTLLIAHLIRRSLWVISLYLIKSCRVFSLKGLSLLRLIKSVMWNPIFINVKLGKDYSLKLFLPLVVL